MRLTIFACPGGTFVENVAVAGLLGMLTPTLHKYLVQKRFARFISGHQETIAHFQDLTVCAIRFRP